MFFFPPTSTLTAALLSKYYNKKDILTAENRYMDPTSCECVGWGQNSAIHTVGSTHTVLTSICRCRIQFGCSCREKWVISGQVYHDEEDIMNRIRCRNQFWALKGRHSWGWICARAEVHSVSYWFRNMSSHHVQKLFSSYQDLDSAYLLLMFCAVLYDRFIKHENMKSAPLCIPQCTLSTMSQSLFRK